MESYRGEVEGDGGGGGGGGGGQSGLRLRVCGVDLCLMRGSRSLGD